VLAGVRVKLSQTRIHTDRQIQFALAVSKYGKLFIGGFGSLFMLDISNKEVSSVDIPGEKNVVSSIIFEGNNTMYLTSGRSLYFAEYTDERINFNDSGSFHCHHTTKISAPYVALNGFIYFGTYDKYVYALQLNGKELQQLWKQETHGRFVNCHGV